MNPTQAQPADGSASRSLADVTEHMMARFHGQVDLPTIARIVRQCRRELIVTRRPVSLDAVEHLAAKRLTDLAERA